MFKHRLGLFLKSDTMFKHRLGLFLKSDTMFKHRLGLFLKSDKKPLPPNKGSKGFFTKRITLQLSNSATTSPIHNRILVVNAFLVNGPQVRLHELLTQPVVGTGLGGFGHDGVPTVALKNGDVTRGLELPNGIG